MAGNGDFTCEWNRFLQNTCSEELCTLKASGSSEPNLTAIWPNAERIVCGGVRLSFGTNGRKFVNDEM
jgi:hypothetical protein